MNNGHSTGYFKYYHGICQGRSPICLFTYFGNRDVVYTSKALRSNVLNISLNNTEHLLSANVQCLTSLLSLVHPC